MPDGNEPIADDEILYRRIPASLGWYNPATGSISPDAFRPTAWDDTGLSLTRRKYASAELVAASGSRGKQFYVAAFRASDLIANAIQPMPAPDADNPGHAEIPSLTFAGRKTSQSIQLRIKLVSLCHGVSGPFDGKRDQP
jgi:hypothetical protein